MTHVSPRCLWPGCGHSPHGHHSATSEVLPSRQCHASGNTGHHGRILVGASRRAPEVSRVGAAVVPQQSRRGSPGTVSVVTAVSCMDARARSGPVPWPSVDTPVPAAKRRQRLRHPQVGHVGHQIGRYTARTHVCSARSMRRGNAADPSAHARHSSGGRGCMYGFRRGLRGG